MASTDHHESAAERTFREATSLQDQGMLPDAEQLYRSILTFEPAHTRCLVRLGLTCAALNRFEEAISCYQQALAVDPDQADAHSNLGNAFHSLERLEHAIACYERALAINPRLAEAHNNLANASVIDPG